MNPFLSRCVMILIYYVFILAGFGPLSFIINVFSNKFVIRGNVVLVHSRSEKIVMWYDTVY